MMNFRQKTRFPAYALGALVLGISAAAQAQTYDIATFSVPDATFATPTGINKAGLVTGYAFTTTGSEGFVYDSNTGVFSFLNTYGQTALYAEAINGAGTIAGPTDEGNGFIATVSPVPLPAALPLFGVALMGLGGLGLRKRKAAQTE
ncbi:MAG TPA: LPXTG cell wall anchor domain-containing protein [Telmatospirillum sp.]|nr:LPXTG cell wall anchor domain-containing protein [Telmatospirillum sp.]